MAANVVRFETHLPVTELGTPDSTAVHAYMTNMGGLAQCYYYQVYKAPDGVTSYFAFYGYIAAGQQNTALGFLTTLNAALSTGPVTCITWQGQSQP